MGDVKYRLESGYSHRNWFTPRTKVEWELEDRGPLITWKQSETRIGSYGTKSILAASPRGKERSALAHTFRKYFMVGRHGT